MATAKKIEEVARLAELLERSTVAILTDYRGLRVADLTALRRRLRGAGLEYQVVKNTLARLAAQRAGKAAIAELLKGPTAIVLGFGEEVAAAKALTDYLREARSALRVKGGLLGQRALSSEEVAILASLPAREVLVAQLLGSLQAPLAGLVGVLSANLRGLVNVLQAHSKQLAEAGRG